MFKCAVCNRSFFLQMLLSLYDLHTILDLILQFQFHVLYKFIYNIARVLALYKSRADKGWAVKRARPSKKV